jgi:predicted transposase YbfD/YdcC
MSLLRCTGHVSLAMLHRRMIKEHDLMVIDTSFRAKKCVSYVQLGRILGNIDYEAFNKINATYFEIQTEQIEGLWLAVDGKELRGTIDGVSGDKRGENVVKMVSHEDLESQIIGFYSGKKESEKTIVQQYFQGQDTLNGAYSLDALHTCPTLLEAVENKGGIYLAQIKKNQKELFEECQHMVQNLPFKYDFEDVEKAHGRIEHRIAGLYPLEVATLDERWQNSGIGTLVAIYRKRERTKDRKISQEIVYFVSNKILTNEIAGNELYRAVRNHWSVESDNFVKDVNLGEDRLKCYKTNRSRAVASVFNVAVNLLRRKNITNNLRVVREECNFDRKYAMRCFATS